MNGSLPRYSVVITAHNESAGIAACLRSLAAQEGLDDAQLEIVLVDDRSSDGTAERASALGLANLRLIRIETAAETGLSSRQNALDVGFRAARGQIILLLDADGIAAPDWVAAMVAPIEAARADAVGGGVAFAGGWLGAMQSVDAAYYLHMCRIVAAMGARSGAFFGSFAFRAELYEACGGFARIGFSLTEDLAFCRALQAGGARLGFRPRQRMQVAACASWGELVQRALRVSAGGGASVLAAVIGLWGVSLPLLLLAALLFPAGTLPLVALARYVAGVLVVAHALVRAGRGALFALAPLYEGFALVTGLRVLLRLRGNRQLEWRGRQYRR